jgi:hypothetical protein
MMTTIVPEAVKEQRRLPEAARALDKMEAGFQQGIDFLSEMVDGVDGELQDFQQILSSKLSSLDQDRAELLQLANSGSMLTIMFRWKGTAFSYIVWDVQLWLSVAIYFVVRFVEFEHYKSVAVPIPVGVVAVVGGLMSFLLVFFIS